MTQTVSPSVQRRLPTILGAVVALSLAIACLLPQPSAAEGPLKGSIQIDGSSTVGPISSRMAETFNQKNSKVRISVGVQGTGGGFKLFCAGKNDINDASRPIADAEKKDCEKNHVEYLELPVAIDGLSVVVSKKNTWCKTLTYDQLKRLWESESKIKLWSELDPKWPAKPIKLYGPGTASGTFDYFCEEVLKKKASSRIDYQQSEDDNVLVKGVSGDQYALGYFGYAYFQENTDELNAVAIATTKEPAGVLPTGKTIGETYPLSRPLFLYVNKKSLARPEVAAFLKFYLSESSQPIVIEAGFIKLHAPDLAKSHETLEKAISGK